MRGLWCVASIATASSNNVSSLLSSLNLGGPAVPAQAQDLVSNPPVKPAAVDDVSAVSGAIGNVLGAAVNQTVLPSVSPVDVGGLIQTALGDGNQTSVIPQLYQINKNATSNSSPAPPSVLTASMNTQQPNLLLAPGLASSMLMDPTSLLNSSSLANLLPALSGGVVNNQSAANLLNFANQLSSSVNNGQSALSTLSGVLRDPQISGAASTLTGSPLLGQVNNLNNLGSTFQSIADITNKSLQSFQPQGVLAGPAGSSSLNMFARNLQAAAPAAAAPAAAAGPLDALAGSLSGNMLDLNAIGQSLLGTNPNMLDLNSLASSLTGGLTGTGNGVDLSALSKNLAPSLQALTQTLQQSGPALASKALQGLSEANVLGKAAPVNSQLAVTSDSGATLTGIASTFITNNYLNAAGQAALKSSPFAQTALQYPDLVSVLNGQAPIASADGNLTPAVTTALAQMNISARTPAALLSTVMSASPDGKSSNSLTNQGVSSLFPQLTANPLLNNTNLPTLATPDLSQLGLDAASLSNLSANLLGSLPGVNATSLMPQKPSGRVLVEKPSPEDVEDLKKALTHLNEALKKAIQAHEHSTEDVSTAAASADRRVLFEWFDNAWESVKNAWSSVTSGDDGDEWKSDVDEAANELANNLETMAKKIRSSDVSSMIQQWFEEAQADLESRSKSVVSQTPRAFNGSASPSTVNQVPFNGAFVNPVHRRALAVGTDKSRAFAVGYEGYNFQGVGDQNAPGSTGNPDLLSGLIPGLTNNNFLASLGALSQPLMNTLTDPLSGALNGLNGSGQSNANPSAGLNSLLSSLLGGGRNFQGVAQAPAPAMDLNALIQRQQQQLAASLNALNAQVSSLGQPLINGSPVSQMKMVPPAASSPTGQSVSNSTAASGSLEKSLQGIDVKEWINNLSTTDMGKAFGLDKIDVSKLPSLPDIDDTELEGFLKKSDWKSFFNGLRLTDLPGLEEEDEDKLREQVKKGKFGDVLAKIDLKKVPGLEDFDLDSIKQELTGSKHLRGRRVLGNDAMSIIQQGSNSLNNQLLGGTTDILNSGAQSAINQLGGLASLANGLTGLTQGLGYGLTGINTGALQGTTLLNTGIGNLLGNINEGIGQNLANLGSGLTGLTSNIGNNLGSGLGSLGTDLGSNVLALPDLSGLQTLLPSNGGDTLANLTSSLIAPVVSESPFGLLPSSSGAGQTAGTLSGINAQSAGLTQNAENIYGVSAPPSNGLPTVGSNGLLNGGSGLLGDLSQLPSLFGMRRLQDVPETGMSVVAPASNDGGPNSVAGALASLTDQLNGMANLSNGLTDFSKGLAAGLSGLGTGINQGTGLIGFGTNSLLGNLNSNLGTQLGSIGSGLSSLMPDVGNTVGAGLGGVSGTMSNLGGQQFASVNETSASNADAAPEAESDKAKSVGIAIPDLKSILGGNYKEVQSAEQPSLLMPLAQAAFPSAASSSLPMPNLSALSNSLANPVNLTTPGLSLPNPMSSGFPMPDLSAFANLANLTSSSLPLPNLGALSIPLTGSLSNATSGLSLPNIAAGLSLPAMPSAGLSLPSLSQSSMFGGRLAAPGFVFPPVESNPPGAAAPALNETSNVASALSVISQDTRMLQEADEVKAEGEDAVGDQGMAPVSQVDMPMYAYGSEGSNPLYGVAPNAGWSTGEEAVNSPANIAEQIEENAASRKNAIQQQVANQIEYIRSLYLPYITQGGYESDAYARAMENQINYYAQMGSYQIQLIEQQTHAQLAALNAQYYSGLGQENYGGLMGNGLVGLRAQRVLQGGPLMADPLMAGGVLPAVPSPFREQPLVSGFNPTLLGGAAFNPPAFAGPLYGPSGNAFGQFNPLASSNAIGGYSLPLGSVVGAPGVDARQFQSAAPVAVGNGIEQLVKTVRESNLDVNQIVKIIGAAHVDWNQIAQKVENGSTGEEILPELIANGLDVNALLDVISSSNVDRGTLASTAASVAPSLGAILADLKGVDLNAVIKSASENGVDLNNVLLMLNKNGVDLQSVADSAVIPMIGHASALAPVAQALGDNSRGLNPKDLMRSVEDAQHKLSHL